MKSLVPSELKEQLSRGEVVLFCGAGISMGDKGLPSGSQLAAELAARADLKDTDCWTLPDIAQMYEIALGYQSLLSYVISRIADSGVQPLPTHHLITMLPVRTIITTNWDTLLEAAMKSEKKAYVSAVRDSDLPYMSRDKTTIIKLHGSIDSTESIVITADDYNDVFRSRPEMSNLVRGHFASQTLLFLGYGLADPNFKLLYQEVVSNLGRHMRRAYAVQLSPSALLCQYWERKNVKVIDARAEAFLQALI